MSRIDHKQVQLYLPKEDWELIRRVAAKRNMSMTSLMRELMGPELAKLKEQPINNDEGEE